MTPSSAIAHYRIISKIGQGGMGTVYRATNTKLGREVAIKLLPKPFAGDSDRLARFSREAKVIFRWVAAVRAGTLSRCPPQHRSRAHE